MNWSLLSLYLTLILGGCTQHQTQKELEKFMNSTVRIPPMELVQNGELTTSQDGMLCCDIKLVVYYTSGKGCLSCWINHLYDLERTFKVEINNIFTPVIVISLDDNNYTEAINQLKSQPHGYPIYVDMAHVFEQTNSKLPTDYRFHTFLLDKNNRVVLVGNPLASDAMWTLFKSTLDNMLAHNGEYVPE